MFPMRCAAILFDLDGVLVDSRRAIETVWRTWAEDRGLDAQEFIRVAHGRRISETLRQVAPSLDVVAETAALDRMEETTIEGIAPVAGAAEMIAGLPVERWGIVTSGSRAVATLRLKRGGLPLPPVFVTAEQVARGKPAPDGYLLGASLLGRHPADCIVFEDAPPGVAAAKAAGMRVIAVQTTHDSKALAAADEQVSGLASLSVESFGDGLLLRTKP